MSTQRPRNEQAAPTGLDGLIAALDGGKTRSLPPVERWNPPFCGDLDMRIAADGRWYYMGTPIGRPGLVKLFASVLKREGDRHFLVTPVEKVGLAVEDAPFLAVEMAVDAAGDPTAQRLSFRTNVDDIVVAGPDNALRFDIDPRGDLKPYLHVRRDLWAKLSRPLVYDLVALGDVRHLAGREMFGVVSGGVFFPMCAASDIENLA